MAQEEPLQTEADLHRLIDTILAMAARDTTKAPVCRELVLKLQAHLPEELRPALGRRPGGAPPGSTFGRGRYEHPGAA